MRDAGSHFFSPHLSVPRVPQQHAGCSRHPHPYQALPGHSAGPGRACLRPHSRRPAAPAAGQREGKRVAAAARVQESDRGAMAMAGPGGAWRGSSCHQLASHLSTHAQCMGVAWAGNERVAGYEADRRGGGGGRRWDSTLLLATDDDDQDNPSLSKSANPLCHKTQATLPQRATAAFAAALLTLTAAPALAPPAVSE